MQRVVAQQGVATCLAKTRFFIATAITLAIRRRSSSSTAKRSASFFAAHAGALAGQVSPSGRGGSAPGRRPGFRHPEADRARWGRIHAPAVARVPGRMRVAAGLAAALAACCSQSSSPTVAAGGARRARRGLNRREGKSSAVRSAVSRSAPAKAGQATGAGEEVDIGRRPGHLMIGQHLAHARQRAVASCVPDDELGDHRVVVRRDFVAFFDAGITRTLIDSAGGARRMSSGQWRKKPLLASPA